MRHTTDGQGSLGPAGGLLGFIHNSTLGSVFVMALNVFSPGEMKAKEDLFWTVTKLANDFATHIIPRPATCYLVTY